MYLSLLPRLILIATSLPMLSSAAVKNRSLQRHEIVTDKELLITSLDVVNSIDASYPGPWSFGHLMDQAFGADKSREAVAHWLENWSRPPTPAPAGVAAVPGRTGLEALVIAPWKERDGYKPGTGEPWLPDFSNAPFRLLAIVNRLDLNKSADLLEPLPGRSAVASSGPWGSVAGVNSDAGEARLVFGLVGPDGKSPEGGMTIIFEYGLDALRHERIYDWAMAWHQLGSHKNFDLAYLSDLAQVTHLFTDRRLGTLSASGAAEERKTGAIERLVAEATSESFQLLRVRVNDGACGKLREFREFSLSKDGLVPAPLAGTPDEVFFTKGSPANRWLARWVADQAADSAALAAEANPQKEKTLPTSFSLPASFDGGGKQVLVTAMVATVPDNNADFHWDGWGIGDSNLRRAFSMQTCCGCHCGDTSTRFYHIEPREGDKEAGLSKFMRTDGSRWRPKDPADRGGFLSSEMEDRKKLYHTLLNPDLPLSEIKRIRGSRQGRVH